MTLNADSVALMWLLVIVLAGVGARLRGADLWRGAVMGVIIQGVGSAAASFGVSVLVATIIGFVVAAIASGPLGLSREQSTSAMLGAVIAFAVSAAIAFG